MTRKIVPMFVLVCGAVAFAQTPPPSQPTPSQQPSKGMKSDTVTVTGCVAEGTGGQFMLNNAMMSHDMSKKEGTTPPSTPPSKPSGTPGASGMTSTYTLVGGDNLKAHVGHKVEVMGSLSSSGSTSPSATTPPSSTGTSASKGPELKVQSVKMVSATCP